MVFVFINADAKVHNKIYISKQKQRYIRVNFGYFKEFMYFCSREEYHFMKPTQNKNSESKCTEFALTSKGQSTYTGDEKSEITRINRQNQYLNRIASKYLDDIFCHYENPVVLDIGCADGENILTRLEGRKYHSLLGIDKNKKKVETANILHKGKNNMFLCCDISTNELHKTLSGYLSKIDKNGFDIIHISSVLLHIENPDIFLRDIRQYLCDNGCVFIQDEDDGMNHVFPYEESFEDCFYIWEHSIESGDRHMGRKIPYYLLSNNYSSINILSTSITSTDFNGEMKDCLWDLYFNCEFWVANDASFYNKADAYERLLKYKKKYPQLKDAYMNGHFFIMLGILFIVAKK